MDDKQISEDAVQANTFKLDREDHLTLMLLTERGRRIEQEQARLKLEKQVLQSENREFIRLLQKYRPDISGHEYSVDLDTGVVTLKEIKS